MKTVRLLAASFVIGIAVAGMPELAPAQPAPGPGSTIENAIILPNIATERAGIAAEHAYIREHFPGWKLGRQALLSDKGKDYDSLELVGPDGAEQTIFFEITAWFGK